MTGALYLHDHPGDLAGIDTGDVVDRQAATKLYVDNNSYSPNRRYICNPTRR